MQWSDVGEWLKANAGPGAALVGSLLTGNVPGAIAAGVSIVSSATGHAVPDDALQQLQTDPATIVRLKELVMQNEAGIREHIRLMKEAELKDLQEEQHETQETVRAGDKAEDPFVRRTRPGQSWVSLLGALFYVFYCTASDRTVDVTVLAAMLTLPWAYAGLRQIGKGVDAISAVLQAKAQGAAK